MPPVAPLPALANGFVTFGHFGRTERLNDTVIATWARILHAVPRSRLILDNRPFQEAAFRDLFLARFAAHGIDPARLDLVYSAPQSRAWAAYGGIDIALDPFPHNAGTTTIEALWQGVPVVSLAGRPTVGRFGASILHAVGLDDWVTDDADAYVARAVAAASDLRLARATARRTCGSELPRRRCVMPPAWRAPSRPHIERYGTNGARATSRVCIASTPKAIRRPPAELAQRMLRRDEADAEAHHVLGLLAYRDHRLGDADSHLQAAIAHAPAQAEMHANHAAILRKLGRLAEAEAAARSALKLEPERVAAHNNLGNILRDAGRYRRKRRLLSRGDPPGARLRRCLGQSGLGAGTGGARAKGGGSRPPGHRLRCNERRCAQQPGSGADASGPARRSRGSTAPGAGPAAGLCPAAQQHPVLPELPPGRIGGGDLRRIPTLGPAACRCRCCPRSLRFELDRSPERRLRVGYVSPDFRQHAVALFAEPLLAAHDRSAVELHCYAEVPAPDAVTERFRALADHWHNTVGLSDAELAEQIRRDRIDVLVDLAGHTAGNRLLTFARKPAPVQVTWLLGHGYSSGLSAMDAFLADAELAPPARTDCSASA